MLRVILLALAVFLPIVGWVAAQSPSITVNGKSGGTTVTGGASMSVAVANGPGSATDWMGVCNSGVTPAPGQCDGAGYSWDYLNCTQTAPTTGIRSATCSLGAPSVAGSYNAVFFSNNGYTALASAPFQVTGSITVNGTSGGTTVTGGANMSVAVANGPGNATDWIGVCNAGVPTSPSQCDYAGYSWDYLNCTQTAPATGVTSATCSLSAPNVAGNYYAGFFSNNTYNVLASAPFQVTVTPTLTLTFAPQMPSIPASTSLGTVVATVTAAWSDGSAFTGTLMFGAPYRDDGGTFALSCMQCATANIVVNPAGPGVTGDGGTVQNVTVVATE